jgi:ADP-ribose pyrophosphatase
MKDRPADFTETTISSKTVYRGRLLHVLEDTVRLPDGRTGIREYIHHPGAAMVVPVLDGDTIVLVRQYRYPARRHFIEIPAGKIEPGEDPLVTAQRELAEECGYTAGSWRHLATIYPCIGYSDERIELYLARELAPVDRGPDHDEFIEVLLLPIEEALTWVEQGKITEVKAIIGLMWAEKILRSGGSA